MIGRNERRCPQCDTRVKRDARWCHNCGTELPEVAPSGRSSSAKPSIETTEDTRAKRLALVLVVLLVLAAVATGLVMRGAASGSIAPNGQETAAGARAAILDRVSTAVPPAFTYTAATLSDDLANAEKAMTPAEASKYQGLLTDDARKGIIDRGQAQTAKVEAVGMVSLTDDTAKVLVLLVQTTTAASSQNQQVQASRLRVTMQKSGNTWLIASMDPF